MAVQKSKTPLFKRKITRNLLNSKFVARNFSKSRLHKCFRCGEPKLMRNYCYQCWFKQSTLIRYTSERKQREEKDRIIY